MAKKRGSRGSKDKGRSTHHARRGLGRMNRANAKNRGRMGSLERHAEDDSVLDTMANDQRMSHSGESLLLKFNRLAKDISDADGEGGEVCGFDGAVVRVRLDNGTEVSCQIRRLIKKMLTGVTNPLVVGDKVTVNDRRRRSRHRRHPPKTQPTCARR